jgi:enoyl-[acyl-carrier protein] reductase II
MLGAQGVQCGTRFLTANECGVHPNYKEKILKARDIDTIVTGKRLGHPVRSLKNQFSRRFYEMEYDAALTERADRRVRRRLAAPCRSGRRRSKRQRHGRPVRGHDSRRSAAAQIIRTMFDQAQEILSGAGRFLDKEQL